MLLIIIILQIFTGIITLIFWNKKQSVVSFLTHLSVASMMFGLMMYCVKMGGFSIYQRNALFGLPFFTDKIRYLPIKVNDMSLFVIIGRLAFCGFTFITAVWHNLHASKLFSEKKWLYALCLMPLLAALVLTLPNVFLKVFAYKFTAQRIVTSAVTITIYVYIALSIALLIWELVEIKYAFYKKRHTSFMISTVLLSVQYIFFSTFDPVSIYQDYQRVSIPSSRLLLNTRNYMWLWYLVFAICIVSTIIVMYQSFKYYKYKYDRSKMEVQIKEKLSEANITSSILMHGLKNQLLTAEILGDRMEREIEKLPQNEEKDALLALNEKLVDTNAYMLERLQTMYQTFLNVKTTLRPITSDELVSAIQKKVGKKYPDFPVKYKSEKLILIADKELLSEAIYNMIINSIEATREVEKPVVTFSIYNMRAKTHIHVSDNGKGIPKELKKQIFLPFTSNKNSNTNWGLGLCYANQIIKRHMGELRFESDNNGTVFYILLPKYDGKNYG